MLFRIASCSTLAALMSASPLAAAPLDRSIIPADVAVTIHVDIEAAVGSKLGGYVLANKDQFNLEGLDALGIFGVDATKDFKGITVYMTKAQPTTGVVVLHTSSKINGFWDHLKTEPHAKAMSVDGYDLLSWDDGGKKKYGFVRPAGAGAGAGASGKGADADRLAFLADDWSVLVDAIKTADGKRPAASSPGVADAPAEAPPGTILLLDVKQVPADMRKPGDVGAQALFGDLRTGRLELGEAADEKVSLRMTMNYEKPETAADMQQVGEGLLAFARLAVRGTPEAAPVLNAARSAKVQADGPSVNLSAQWTVDEAKAALRAMAEANRAKAKEASKD